MFSQILCKCQGENLLKNIVELEFNKISIMVGLWRNIHHGTETFRHGCYSGIFHIRMNFSIVKNSPKKPNLFLYWAQNCWILSSCFGHCFENCSPSVRKINDDNFYRRKIIEISISFWAWTISFCVPPKFLAVWGKIEQ